MRKVRTHIFNNKRFDIEIGDDDDGFVTNDQQTVFILADLNTKRGLTTATHEAMHASNPTMHEETVERMGEEIGSFLWRLGYRCVIK